MKESPRDVDFKQQLLEGAVGIESIINNLLQVPGDLQKSVQKDDNIQ